MYIYFFRIIFADFFSPVIAGKKLDIFVITISIILATFAIMYKANWVFSDDWIFISTTAINKYIPLSRDLAGGRFYL